MSKKSFSKGWKSSGTVALVCGVLLGSVAGIPATVMAEESITQLEALQLIRSANDAFEEGDYETAYSKYEQAYEVLPEPTIRYRMGQSAEGLGRVREAIGHFEAYLDEGDDEERLIYIAETVPKLRQILPAMVTLSSSPAGAEVVLHGEEPVVLGTTPGVFEVGPGAVKVSLRLDGHQEWVWEGELGANQSEEWEAELDAAEPAVADGPREQEGMDLSLDPVESEGMSVLAISGWSLVGLGVAGLATGGYFSFQQAEATQLVNSYDKQVDTASREELDTLKEEAMGHYQVARISYIGGGILAAAGAGLLVFERMNGGEDRDPGLSLEGGVSPSGGYVGIRGRF